MPRRRKTQFDGPIATALNRAPVWAFFIGSIALLIFSQMYPKQVDAWRITVTDIIHPAVEIAATPVQATRRATDYLLKLPDLTAENERLRLENQRLQAWYDEAMRLTSENIHLKQLNNSLPETVAPHITARVIADTGGVFSESLMIRAGKKDGVDDGYIALAGGQVIGRITAAGQDTSRLLLLTDMNSRIPVMAQSTGQRAILTGQNTPAPLLRFPANQARFDDGTRLVTSGHGGRFPPNLPIGRVVQPNKAQQMSVELFADLHRLAYVQLVAPTMIDRSRNLK